MTPRECLDRGRDQQGTRGPKKPRPSTVLRRSSAELRGSRALFHLVSPTIRPGDPGGPVPVSTPLVLLVLFQTIKVSQFPSKIYSNHHHHHHHHHHCEADSTCQSSTETKTVVAEAAQKTARKPCRSRRQFSKGFRHRSSCCTVMSNLEQAPMCKTNRISIIQSQAATLIGKCLCFEALAASTSPEMPTC